MTFASYSYHVELQGHLYLYVPSEGRRHRSGSYWLSKLPKGRAASQREIWRIEKNVSTINRLMVEYLKDIIS